METTVKERAITLTAQEVNAVLPGDKTQHRVPFDFEFIENVSSIQKAADECGITISDLVTGAYQDGRVLVRYGPLLILIAG